MITSNNKLTETQLNDLNQLLDACKNFDESTPYVYQHLLSQERALPTNLLYYQNNKLIGFLSIFFFYDKAVEVALLVHPEKRRKGIAKTLLTQAAPLIANQHINTLIFSSPSHKSDAWLKKMGFSYLHSEYHMQRNELTPLMLINKPMLTFRPATKEDLLVLCQLDEECFPKKKSNLSHHILNLLSDRTYHLIIACYNNKPIGKAHIRWENKGATLSDIAITPELQGRGYGATLIAYCINLALSEGKPHLALDVETHNQKALNLYTRLGFVTQNACDYWSIECSKLNNT